MGTPWTLGSGRYGPRITMHGPWTRHALRAAHQHQIREIELNHAKGWPRQGVDYSFLSDLPDLEAIEIVTMGADEIGAVNGLSKLRYVALETYCNTPLDFASWPLLEECAIEWRAAARSLFDHRAVRRVFINKWNEGRDLQAFSEMTQLESLRLYSPTRLESLAGIEGFGRLEGLEIALARKLSGLGGVEHLVSLRHFELNTCRNIGCIAPLSSLRRLRELHLINCGVIDTIRPLAGLPNLERFLFYESTDIADGDLSPLKSLPNLKSVAFQERPHYSLSRTDLPGA